MAEHGERWYYPALLPLSSSITECQGSERRLEALQERLGAEKSLGFSPYGCTHWISIKKKT